MRERERGGGGGGYEGGMLAGEFGRFRWRRGTRLGRLVVPLVWRTRAVASAAAGSRDPLRAPPWLLISSRPVGSSSTSISWAPAGSACPAADASSGGTSRNLGPVPSRQNRNSSSF